MLPLERCHFFAAKFTLPLRATTFVLSLLRRRSYRWTRTILSIFANAKHDASRREPGLGREGGRGAAYISLKGECERQKREQQLGVSGKETHLV